MAQFDIYPTSYPNAPLVVDIQCNFLSRLATRAVIPLEPATVPGTDPLLQHLQPIIDVRGTPYVLNTPEIANMPTADLKTPLLSVAATHRRIIMDALDFLIQGF